MLLWSDIHCLICIKTTSTHFNDGCYFLQVYLQKEWIWCYLLRSLNSKVLPIYFKCYSCLVVFCFFCFPVDILHIKQFSPKVLQQMRQGAAQRHTDNGVTCSSSFFFPLFFVNHFSCSQSIYAKDNIGQIKSSKIKEIHVMFYDRHTKAIQGSACLGGL